MTRRSARRLTTGLLGLALAAPLLLPPTAPATAEPPAHAQGRGKDKGGPPGKHGGGDGGGTSGGSGGAVLSDPGTAATALGAAVLADLLFSDEDRRIIHQYFQPYRTGGQSLPPGLAKRGGSLPPGLAKRGGALPPGLQREPLPDDLLSRLPTIRDGYRRVIVDDDVVLIHIASGVIADIIRDVF
ncbi:hypothetical protein [Roseospira navarrensis]|uniref:Uncharacterized protein n=1 Tax=Roseospira navarrensis TaxID=140058 RepID=A0A7X2D506_9PROT|nr:hypothetical protein [Roseospira navarrensis]MQX38483.1 hypothetical protein [Roseospira navarrensis]